MKLLDRWFIKETLQCVALFLIGFYFLFSLIDYSTHIQEFLKLKEISFSQIALYYLSLLAHQLPLLLTLAFLIATIKVLTSANIHKELTALRASGIATHRLLSPFLLVGLVMGVFLGLNYEFFMPHAERAIESFQTNHLRPMHKRDKRSTKLHTLILEDQTKLIAYTDSFDHLEDAFWILSADEIWHFKQVDLKKGIGYLGDQLVRNREGYLSKGRSEKEHPLSLIREGPCLAPLPEKAALTTLWSQMAKQGGLNQDYINGVRTHFFYKLISLFFPLMSLITIAPYCMAYRRHFKLFGLYALALIGFITFFTMMDSLVIAGENGLLPPALAIFILPFFLNLFSLRRLSYAR